jgi:hypothetical protein
LACSVFSAEEKASKSARQESRGISSSSHCSKNSTGMVTLAAASASVSWPARPKTAAVIRSSTAAKGIPIALPIDTPQNPHRATRADVIDALQGIHSGPPLGNRPRRQPNVIPGDLRADGFACSHPSSHACREPLVLLGSRTAAVSGGVDGPLKQEALVLGCYLDKDDSAIAGKHR